MGGKHVLLLLFLSVSTFAQEDCKLKNMSVGELRITGEKHMKKMIKQNEIFVLAATSMHCAHCCKAEPKLQTIYDALEDIEIPFVRIDVGKHDFIKKRLVDADLPSIHIVKKNKYYFYSGAWTADGVIDYLTELQGSIPVLTSEKEAQAFLSEDGIRVLGTFYEDERDNESPFAEFQEAQYKTLNWKKTKFAQVLDQEVIKMMKNTGRWIERLNNIIIKRENGTYDVLELASNEGEVALKTWISHHAVDIVDEYTDDNMMIYADTRLPILMFFIEKDHLQFDTYLDLFSDVAEDYGTQVKFTWIDQTNDTIKTQKKGLGLRQKDQIGIAFNLPQQRIMAYPEDQPINVADLKQFVQDFLDGKVQVKRTQGVELVDGKLEEAFKDVERIGYDEFRDKVVGGKTDDMVMIYNTESEQHVELRDLLAEVIGVCDSIFKQGGMKTAKFYRYDLAQDAAPRNIDSNNPLQLVFLPAKRKQPPFMQYNGEASVEGVMLWVEANADKKFKLGRKDDPPPTEGAQPKPPPIDEDMVRDAYEL